MGLGGGAGQAWGEAYRSVPPLPRPPPRPRQPSRRVAAGWKECNTGGEWELALRKDLLVLQAVSSKLHAKRGIKPLGFSLSLSEPECHLARGDCDLDFQLGQTSRATEGTWRNPFLSGGGNPPDPTAAASGSQTRWSVEQRPLFGGDDEYRWVISPRVSLSVWGMGVHPVNGTAAVPGDRGLLCGHLCSGEGWSL